MKNKIWCRHNAGMACLSCVLEALAEHEADEHGDVRRFGELSRALKNENAAGELVVQAYKEWTPAQGPTSEWARKAKVIKERRE